ncbi:hypothetical protein, partial [Streptomyces sp. NPDC007205]|uniref:hypothetical protein n=1 Tax=Streptomyces sp. NPDC007205 TaxID=3154316 RepID=UPI0033C6C167
RRAHTQGSTANATAKEEDNHPKAPPHTLKIKLETNPDQVLTGGATWHRSFVVTDSVRRRP